MVLNKESKSFKNTLSIQNKQTSLPLLNFNWIRVTVWHFFPSLRGVRSFTIRNKSVCSVTWCTFADKMWCARVESVPRFRDAIVFTSHHSILRTWIQEQLMLWLCKHTYICNIILSGLLREQASSTQAAALLASQPNGSTPGQKRIWMRDASNECV